MPSTKEIIAIGPPGLTHITACLLAESPKRPFCIEGFDEFVACLAAPTATGWNDSCQAGFAPAEDARLFTAHSFLTLRGRLRTTPIRSEWRATATASVGR